MSKLGKRAKLLRFFAGVVGAVGLFAGVLQRSGIVSMVVLWVVRVGDYFIGLGVVFASQELLQTNEGWENQGQFTDDEGLQGKKGESS